jgi:pseudaminic acid cytidylyltransferase
MPSSVLGKVEEKTLVVSRAIGIGVEMKHSIAIIPARGGSKRIPRKNVKKFMGEPIITYTIKTALMSGCFSEVMVSTDDDEIASIALEAGAKVPFMRSKENSNDHAMTRDVLFEVLDDYKHNGHQFDYGCCIYPTAVLTTEKNLVDGLNILTQQSADSVMPVAPVSFSVEKVFVIENERMALRDPSVDLYVRNQDLRTSYHDAGQFYWFNVDALVKKGALFTEKTYPLVLDELQIQDIDTEGDWKVAEIKYRILSELAKT